MGGNEQRTREKRRSIWNGGEHKDYKGGTVLGLPLREFVQIVTKKLGEV